MRVTTNAIYEMSEAAISDHYGQISKLQNAISSGISLASSGDDPVAMASVTTLEAHLDNIEQMKKNAFGAKIELQGEQTQLTSFEKLVQNVKVLVSKASTSGTSSDDMKAYANELGQDIQQMASIANSKNELGENLFSGTATSDNAYDITKDSDGNITAMTYLGNDDQRKVHLGDSASINTFQSGNAVFGSGADSIFTKLIALQQRMKSGKILDKDESAAASEGLEVDQKRNIASLSRVQDSFNQATFEVDMHQSLISNYKGMLSNLRDTDIATTASKLSEQMTFLKATMSASVQIEKLSLFGQG